MQPFFEDNTIDDLIIVAQKYKEKVDAWCLNQFYLKKV